MATGVSHQYDILGNIENHHLTWHFLGEHMLFARNEMVEVLHRHNQAMRATRATRATSDIRFTNAMKATRARLLPLPCLSADAAVFSLI